MTSTESAAVRHELTETAAELRTVVEHIHQTGSLLVPPGRHDWSGAARDGFVKELEELWRRVLLAADLLGSAARLCDIVAQEG